METHFKLGLRDSGRTRRVTATPLHVACGNGCSDVTSMLLDLGVNIECREEWTRATPMIFASKAGHLDVARLLVQRKANLEAQDHGKETPLISASKAGHLDVVRLLVQHKASLEAQDQHKETPLISASKAGHLNVVQFLVEHNADLEAQAILGYTPLRMATKHNHIFVVQLLLQHHAQIEYLSGLWVSAFNTACARGHQKIAKLMLDSGRVNIDGGEIPVMPPLTCACFGGCLAMVEFLLAQGADINKRSSGCWSPSPIVAALSSNNRRVAEFLLAKGAKFSDDDKLDALGSVCRWGHLDTLEFLLSLNVPVDVADVNGYTPLHHACDQCHKEIVKRLLPLIKDCDKTTKTGYTPLILACNGFNHRGGQCEIVEALLGRNVDVNKANSMALRKACHFRDRKTVELLLSAGAIIDACTVDKRCVTIACLSGNIDVADLLLSHGATVNRSELETFAHGRLFPACMSALNGKAVVRLTQYTPLQCLYFALNFRVLLLQQMAWMTAFTQRARVKPVNLEGETRPSNCKNLNTILVAMFKHGLPWTSFQMIVKKMPLIHPVP